MATPIALQNLLTLSSPQYSTRMTGGDYATTAASAALGIGAGSYNIKKLEEQLKQAEKEYQNLLSQQEFNKKITLLNSGMLSEKERNKILDDLYESSGYEISPGFRGIFGRESDKRPSMDNTFGEGNVIDLTGMLKSANLASRYGETESHFHGGLAGQGYRDIASGFKNKLLKLLNS